MDDLGLVQAVDRSLAESCVGTDPFRRTRLRHRGPEEHAVTVAGTRGAQQAVLVVVADQAHAGVAAARQFADGEERVGLARFMGHGYVVSPA